MLAKRKKLFFRCFLYGCGMVILLLWCFVEYVQTLNMEPETVYNRSHINLGVRKILDLKTDGRQIYLLTADHYIVALNADGDSTALYFPAKMQYGSAAFCMDCTNATLLYHVPDDYVLEFDRKGVVLGEYTGTLARLQQTERFQRMDLPAMFAQQTRCILDDGAEYELDSGFLLQKLIRTRGSERAIIKAFFTLSAGELFLLYCIAGFIMLCIALKRRGYPKEVKWPGYRMKTEKGS